LSEHRKIGASSLVDIALQAAAEANVGGRMDIYREIEDISKFRVVIN